MQHQGKSARDYLISSVSGTACKKHLSNNNIKMRKKSNNYHLVIAPYCFKGQAFPFS